MKSFKQFSEAKFTKGLAYKDDVAAQITHAQDAVDFWNKKVTEIYAQDVTKSKRMAVVKNQKKAKDALAALKKKASKRS